MRTISLSLAALLVLGLTALAVPPAAADTTCGDLGCCQAYEHGKLFLRCAECVVIGNDWDIDTDACVIY